MKKLISILLLAVFLTSCNIGIGKSSVEITSDTTVTESTAAQINVDIAETTTKATETSAVEVPLTSEERNERYAETLVKHIVQHVFTEDRKFDRYVFNSHDLSYFFFSLCLFDESAEHPYSDMISLSAEQSCFEISLEDADIINSRTFRISNFKLTSTHKELLDTVAGCYRIPKGVGIYRSPFAAMDMQTYTENGQIFVEFNLVDGYSGFEDEEHNDLGRYRFTFSEEDFILLDFACAEKLVKDTPYIIDRYEDNGVFTEYNFTDDGELIIHVNKTEEYYNSEGLLYKSIQYDENGRYTAKRFYTYKDGLLEMAEEYDSNGELTFKGTYAEGKPLCLEYSDYWIKNEYNEAGQLIREEFSTTKDVRYTHGVTEYTYDESGRLVRVQTEDNEGKRGYVFIHDESGKLVETKRISGDLVLDYRFYTYYPDGAIKTEQKLSDGYIYELYFYEYLPNGVLWRESKTCDPDVEVAGVYEYVKTYSFYDDGRIKSAMYEIYDLESGEYVKENEVFISYNGGGRVRTDIHYQIGDDGEMEFVCELLLIYNENGNLVSCYTVRGEWTNPFNYTPLFNYRYSKYYCDEYGRVEEEWKNEKLAKRYSYMDCTAEQYELYQKVMANRKE